MKRPCPVVAQKALQYDRTISQRSGNDVAVGRSGMGKTDFFTVSHFESHVAEVIRFDTVCAGGFDMSFSCDKWLPAGRDELDG